MKGDPGVTGVSVKMMCKDMLEETDKRDGKVIGVWTMRVAADGKSVKGAYDDKLQGTKTEYVAIKQ